jgi:hypothetical protein
MERNPPCFRQNCDFVADGIIAGTYDVCSVHAKQFLPCTTTLDKACHVCQQPAIGLLLDGKKYACSTHFLEGLPDEPVWCTVCESQWSTQGRLCSLCREHEERTFWRMCVRSCYYGEMGAFDHLYVAGTKARAVERFRQYVETLLGKTCTDAFWEGGKEEHGVVYAPDRMEIRCTSRRTVSVFSPYHDGLPIYFDTIGMERVPYEEV